MEISINELKVLYNILKEKDLTTYEKGIKTKLIKKVFRTLAKESKRQKIDIFTLLEKK